MRIRTQMALTLTGVAALCFLVSWLVGLLFARNLALEMITQEHKKQINELASISEMALDPAVKPSTVLAEHLRSIPEVTPNVDYAYIETMDRRILLHTDPRFDGRTVAEFKSGRPAGLEYVGAIRREGRTVATARLGIRDGFGATVFKDLGGYLLPTIAALTVCGVLLSLALGFGLAFVLSRPITRIAGAARDVGRGNLDVSVPVVSSSELGELERDFNGMVSRLRELDDLKDEFIASVSHDLRSPMAAIHTCLEFMLRDDPERDKILPRHRRILTALTENATRLSVFVSNVLDAAKMKAGKMEYRLEPVAVSPVVDSLAELYGSILKNRGLTLSCAVPGTLQPVLADRAHLERVLANLVSNAIKFTRSGGRISIAAQSRAGAIEVTVADTGVGIEPEALEKLFKPFQQADSGREAKDARGTGLGLFLVKRTIESMGGTVGIGSKLGEGTRVWFSLPSAQAADSSRRSAPADPSSRGAKILVIDDNEAFAEMTRQLLEAKGYRASITIDARTARRDAASDSPDLILMDMDLGGMRAESLIRDFKADVATAAIPIILCSATSDLAEVQRTLESGAACFLPKPLRSGELDLRIREVLGARETA